MPRIVIKSLPFQEAIDIQKVLKTLGNDISRALNLELARIVITWEFIPKNQFLFNGDLVAFQPHTTHHPMVDITLVEGMAAGMEKLLVHIIVEKLSQELEVDYSNICVVINQIPSGKLFVSGSFIER